MAGYLQEDGQAGAGDKRGGCCCESPARRLSGVSRINTGIGEPTIWRLEWQSFVECVRD